MFTFDLFYFIFNSNKVPISSDIEKYAYLITVSIPFNCSKDNNSLLTTTKKIFHVFYF